MRNTIYMIIIALVLSTPVTAIAGVDPGRATAIELASDQAKKTLDAQVEAQGLMTTGHIWISEEVKATTSFQKEFNDYLDSLHNALAVAAEIYGIYYEVTMTSKNIKNINEVLQASPTNALALAFSAKRNTVYTNLIISSIDIIKDIRKVCFEKSKMTEKERDKIIGSIRPKLRKINKQLRALTFALRYTSFLDVWNELLQRSYRINPHTKHDILTRCRREWLDNAKSIR